MVRPDAPYYSSVEQGHARHYLESTTEMEYNAPAYSARCSTVRKLVLVMQTRLPMEIVDRDMARVLAEKTEAQRLEIGWGMWRSAVRMMTRLLRAEHPDWTDEEVHHEVAGRMSHGG